MKQDRAKAFFTEIWSYGGIEENGELLKGRLLKKFASNYNCIFILGYTDLVENPDPEKEMEAAEDLARMTQKIAVE